MNNTISTRGMHQLQMRLLNATNHSLHIFVMKCIENIFYLLFSAESDQKNMCIFSCECTFNLLLSSAAKSFGCIKTEFRLPVYWTV